jgi:hypothetical protein
MDWKSIGLCPQGFESPRCRFVVFVCVARASTLYRDLANAIASIFVALAPQVKTKTKFQLGKNDICGF